MLELHSLSFGYPGHTPVFDGFDWRVDRGESWAVLGPSGCGKSTLLYLLAGLKLPSSGTIRVDGAALRKPRPRTGLVLQDYGLLPWATLRDNVTLGLRVRRFYGPDGIHAPAEVHAGAVNAAADAWLEKLGLAGVGGSFPGQVSGGQRQRAALARTLALEPDLLLMDEPFASLDAPTRESLQKVVMQLQAETGLTLVIVTHSVEEAALLGRKILMLGLPPNRAARVIPNPGAGSAAHLNTPAYLETCARLRHELGEGLVRGEPA
jgi:NitT/TauT family transport system ATP-binding protein